VTVSPRPSSRRRISRDVEDAVDKTIAGPEETGEDRWDEVDDRLHDLSWIAQSLLGYEDGSPVGVASDNQLLASIDLSEASELVADLAVGDPVVIAAPPDRNLVDARGPGRFGRSETCLRRTRC
jgi:hypothetical protein